MTYWGGRLEVRCGSQAQRAPQGGSAQGSSLAFQRAPVGASAGALLEREPGRRHLLLPKNATPTANHPGESSTTSPLVSTLLCRLQRRGLFPRGRVDPRQFVYAALVLGAALAGCTAEARLALAPLGSHQVEVGQHWQLQVQAQGAVAPLQWRVIRGPADALALPNSSSCLLTWTPSPFDLAPTKPGQPRAQGSVQAITVEVRDATGAAAQSSGSLQALPVPLP